VATKLSLAHHAGNACATTGTQAAAEPQGQTRPHLLLRAGDLLHVERDELVQLAAFPLLSLVRHQRPHQVLHHTRPQHMLIYKAKPQMSSNAGVMPAPQLQPAQELTGEEDRSLPIGRLQSRHITASTDVAA
jgi:hypothetical protein